MFKIADVVTFNKNAEETLEGVITRIWTNNKYVTILVDGRSTYVREIANVRHSQSLKEWRDSHGIPTD